ncbi:hypothetical protein COMNV_01254 [Commensalibacter sp. Nvir]|uniref:protoporphyrinogen oxidase HemJ n=1 Tax=Commensalibacter sp. Nvir TaxID=3069817 RepID=UPI002D6A3606|nr:hypothetical protein COMNV_01254 [Commensalibacter sp. Nvir]
MITVLVPYVLWLKAIHIITVIAWMAGQFYLPRLFVYHCQTNLGSEESERFKIMEYKLLRMIINPAMTASFVSGIVLAIIPGVIDYHTYWWIVKLVCLFVLTGYHGMCSRWRRQFEIDQNIHSEKFYRYMNEVPTILMITIVIMVVVQPF